MSDRLYNAARLAGSPFAFRCEGLANIRDHGPAVYVANHLAAVGPIETVLSLPVRLYPWVIGETMDHARAPRYLYDDLVAPSWRLRGRFGMFVSSVIARLAVGFLWGLGCVEVDSNRGRYLAPFRRSLALLQEGKSLLIFPENPRATLDPVTRMRPFQRGFVLLCPLFQNLTGRPLPLYPVAVSPQRRMVTVGEPIFYEANGRRREDVLRTCARLEAEVQRLYLKGADGGLGTGD